MKAQVGKTYFYKDGSNEWAYRVSFVGGGIVRMYPNVKNGTAKQVNMTEEEFAAKMTDVAYTLQKRGKGAEAPVVADAKSKAPKVETPSPEEPKA